MDKKLKAKWVKALCSGEYEQGKGALRRAGRFCCLGVLADVAGVDSRSNGFLEDENDNAILVPTEIQQRLAELNDRLVPFEMIAGLIDEAL